MLNLTPKVMVSGAGALGVIRPCGGALVNGISALMKETPELSGSFYHVRTQQGDI